MATVDRRTDGSERVKYDYDGYYAYIRRGRLSDWPNYSAESHWHDDLEFISVLSGEMQYNVNGEIVTLTPGSGIFVNARQMHHGFSETHTECDFICVLLHPMLLCTSQSIDRDFVSPIITDASLPYIFLDRKLPWHGQILDQVQIMLDAAHTDAAPLHIQTALYHIWILLTENARKLRRSPGKSDRRLAVLKNMLGYIHGHYAEKVTLEAIAAAGSVSKSTSLVIFRKYLRDTPTNYLITYRLSRAVRLLRDTDARVTDIALETGFGGVSYFAETFRRHYGCSPGEYRKNMHDRS